MEQNRIHDVRRGCSLDFIRATKLWLITCHPRERCALLAVILGILMLEHTTGFQFLHLFLGVTQIVPQNL